MELLLISKPKGWEWYVFTGTPGSLVARSPSPKTTTDAAPQAACRKNADFRKIPESVFYLTDTLPDWFSKWEKEYTQQTTGVLYALSHPAFTGLIKVGYTDKPLEETIRRQSNLLPIPEPFKLLEQWEVKEGQIFLRDLRKQLKASGFATEKRSFFKISLTKLQSSVNSLKKEVGG